MDLRVLLIALVAVPLPTAVAQRTPRGQQPNQALVSDSAVGTLRLGMTLSEVRGGYQVVADTVLPNWDFVEPERTLLVRIGPDTVRAAVSPQGRVDRIDIDSRRLRTTDGIRVGSPLQSILKPGATAGVSEATVGLQLPGHCGLRFVIAGAPDLEPGAQLSYGQLRAFPRAARISRIEIWGCGHE